MLLTQFPPNFRPQFCCSAKFLVDTGASVSVFPHLPRSPSAPGSNVQLRTANGSPMNTYGSRSLALQFGSRCFEWSFLLANVSMPILDSDFLRHNHLLVDVAGSHLLDSSILEYIPAVSSSSANNKSDLYTALLSAFDREFFVAYSSLYHFRFMLKKVDSLYCSLTTNP